MTPRRARRDLIAHVVSTARSGRHRGADVSMGLSRHARSRGQASMEYVVVCLALALALGIGMSNKQSVLWQLLDALRIAYQRFSYALSLPL